LAAPRPPFPAPRSPHQKGFSLLEVIAAVLLLAITFATLMRVAGSSLNLTARAAERSEAAMWARSLLDSAYVLEPPRIGASSGRFDARYQWRLDVRPWQAPAAASGPTPAPLTGPAALRMVRLDLEVLWTGAGHHYNAHFSTLRLVAPQEQQPEVGP
jgi:general secretion pathway protein I